MIKTNYHTHTEFCDAKNTAEEMVIAAMEKGISILGFSSHAMYPFAGDWHIGTEKYADYVNEINRLEIYGEISGWLDKRVKCTEN